MLLRNRAQLEPEEVLPLFFRLFRCQDKALRQMLFRHIITGGGVGGGGGRKLVRHHPVGRGEGGLLARGLVGGRRGGNSSLWYR